MTINIDDLTIGQLRALRAQIDAIIQPATAAAGCAVPPAIPVGTKVLVRAHSSGVHLGVLVRHIGQEVVLRTGARRIHRWRGANTLTEIAARGVDSAKSSGYTRVSDESPDVVVLTEAIELLPVSPAAWESICSAGWAS